LHKGLVENKYDIEIERRNPKSPLFSVKSFEALNLKPELLKVWKLVILIKVLHA
jgi:ATP-dependent RNA helicase DDX19/DBP5